MTLAWVGFNAFVLLMWAVDLGVFRGREKPISMREACAWSALWVALSLGVCALVWRFLGRREGTEFLAGYVVEYSLSLDNLFVFLLLFRGFRVRAEAQHRLLFWGILGEFAMRAPLILVGARLVSSFRPVLYAFGVFLVYTAVRMALAREHADGSAEEPGGRPVRWIRKLLPVTAQAHGQHFTAREAGRWKLTPLGVALVALNLTDVMFAVDSIPAVLGVTDHAFVAYASNVCAIFGLRSLYFVVAGLMDKFRYLRVGVSVILGFIGVKMLAAPWYEVGIGASLGAIVSVLAISIGVSALHVERNH